MEFDAAGDTSSRAGAGRARATTGRKSSTASTSIPRAIVWIGGNGKTDHHLLKFTRDGKFVMQIGRKGAEQGQQPTPQNVNQAADTFVHAQTNELFVADGYGNQPHHRVRRRHRRVQAHVGRVRQSRLRQGAARSPRSPEESRIPAMEETGTGPGQFEPSRARGARVEATISSTSPTAAASACRCSRSKASSSRRPSSTAGARRRIAATARRSPAPAFSHDPEQRFLLRREPQPRPDLGARPQDARAARSRSGGPASRPASSTCCTT